MSDRLPTPAPATATAAERVPLLRVDGLRKSFTQGASFLGRREASTVHAVDDVSFEIHPGETLSLVGESGSGKSTTAYCVLRLIEPDAGSITFKGTELTDMGRRAMAPLRRHMQLVFQDPYGALNPRRTIEDSIIEPLRIHAVGTDEERRARARELCELVGMDPAVLPRHPHQFSGGQRQRIVIARALALGPELLVCDEPVSALDVSVRAQILNLLKDLQDELGLALLFIAHDLAVVRTMSDRVMVMNQGKVVETGTAHQVYESPQHEYTRALLESVPIADPRKARARREAAEAARPS
jgi:ABC-type glutathione transport system ATPase component